MNPAPTRSRAPGSGDVGPAELLGEQLRENPYFASRGIYGAHLVFQTKETGAIVVARYLREWALFALAPAEFWEERGSYIKIVFALRYLAQITGSCRSINGRIVIAARFGLAIIH